MASSLTSFLPLALLALCAGLHTAAAVEADERSFPMIRANGVPPRQWLLKMERGNKLTGEYIRVNCTKNTVGACRDQFPPIYQNQGDVVRLTYTVNVTAIKTINNEVPTRMEARLCYSAPSFTDRAWRKKNKPYPRLSQNCPRKCGSFDFVGPVDPVDPVANTHVFVGDFDEFDEVPTATMFPMLWVYCGDKVCAFESAEGNATATPPVNGNFVETSALTGITKGMRIAAITCSVVSPLLFILFFVADHFHYKKTGKPILL